MPCQASKASSRTPSLLATAVAATATSRQATVLSPQLQPPVPTLVCQSQQVLQQGGRHQGLQLLLQAWTLGLTLGTMHGCSSNNRSYSSNSRKAQSCRVELLGLTVLLLMLLLPAVPRGSLTARVSQHQAQQLPAAVHLWLMPARTRPTAQSTMYQG